MKKYLVAVCLMTVALSAWAKASSGKISATLFDGKGNKEVLAEATRTTRTPPPAPQQAASQAPASSSTTITDGKGGAVRTIEQRGDSTTVKDGKGRTVSTSTRNPDGSTTVRDGTGRVRATTQATGTAK